MHPEDILRYPHNDIGLGQLFADYCRDKARYNSDKNCWMVYNGKIWESDQKEIRLSEIAKEMTVELKHYGAELKDDYAGKLLDSWADCMTARKKRDLMIIEARSIYPVKQEDFDTDPYLFNMNNCTINLKTGEVREHRAEDMLTRMSPVNYNPEASCRRFETFINEIMCGDRELADFLQKCVGYGMTGSTEHECLFILYGKTTRNGKGTLCETILKVLGDYADNSDPELLSSKSFSAGAGGHSEGIARLNGRRFINMSEPPKTMVFNAALVKRVTGSDSITCRFLHQNSFVYKPQGKFFINTNYLPNVNDATLFSSGRMIVIPFNRHFEAEEQDTKLKSFFVSEENRLKQWFLMLRL